MRTVKVKNLILGEGRPKICVPLTGRTEEELVEQAISSLKCSVDLIEWRIDYYENVYDFAKLETTAVMLREILREVPLLITFRSREEGGEREIGIDDYAVLLTQIMSRQMADMLDIEVLKGDTLITYLVETARENGLITIGSSHDFHKTPSKEEMIQRLCKMQDLGVDISKIAVAPENEEDVLVLLNTALEMKRTYADRPFITISMKKLGMISRIAGETFGSCLTFATAGKTSAPGQMDADLMKQVLEQMHDMTNIQVHQDKDSMLN